jgi:signal transduction histidine kinase
MASHWHWYHFYFLLALFDVLVIISSLSLYHRTLASYKSALDALGRLDEAQRWVGALRFSLIHLNAPGNDVFESRQVAKERDRFDRTWTNVQGIMRRAPEFGIDLSVFRGHVDDMVEEENAIFDAFVRLESESLSEEDYSGAIRRASARMAFMDRYQAQGLEALSNISLNLSEKQHSLLSEYGMALERSAALEKYFLGLVLLILLGAFWFGRRLQRAHEVIQQERHRAMEERLERLAAVGEVCSSVSHGIKNPLAAINSSAQLALEFGTLDENTKRRVVDILFESRRLNDRINRLLDFSNAKPAAFHRCEIGEVVRGAVDEVRPKLDEMGIRVRVKISESPIWVMGDHEWLAQSVIELVSNAMEHMTSPGTIDVICSMHDDPSEWASIEVIDDGPGIPKTIRPHIFDLFFTSKAEGNGIGLASVKRAVEMHGGRVSAGDTEGSGARMTIELPAPRNGL